MPKVIKRKKGFRIMVNHPPPIVPEGSLPHRSIHPDDPYRTPSMDMPQPSDLEVARPRPPIQANPVPYTQAIAIDEEAPVITEGVATMPMSRDRVKFKLDFNHTDGATRRAFNRAFGMRVPPATGPYRSGRPALPNVQEIICRPSQFARFLIYRRMHGGQNMFRILEAELFTPEPARPQPIDVSENPASVNPTVDEEESDV